MSTLNTSTELAPELSASYKLNTEKLPQVITLYRDGLCNFNGEASQVLTRANVDTLMLLPPSKACPRWMMIPQGDIHIAGRADRSRHLRFRCPTLARSLFAALPDTQASIQMLLEPTTTNSWRLVAQ